MSVRGPRDGAPVTESLTSNVEALAAALAPLVAAHLAAAPPAEPEPLIDADAAGELLGVPATWVRRQARDGCIPHVRLGHYVRFDRGELLAWRAEQATGTGPVSRRGDRPMTTSNASARGARGPDGGPK